MHYVVKIGGQKVARFSFDVAAAKWAMAQPGYVELYYTGRDGRGLVGQWNDGIPTPEFASIWAEFGGSINTISA